MSLKFHFIYRTINLLTKEYYLGRHSTNSLNDGYLGSGKKFKEAVKKYGKQNFRREILVFCDSFDELLNNEKALVTEEKITDPKIYNLNIGGIGKTSSLGKHWNLSVETKHKMSLSKMGAKSILFGKPSWHSGKTGVYSEEVLENNRAKHLGKNHSEETKFKMAQSKSKNWTIVCPNGKTQSVFNLKKFCSKNNLNPGVMSLVASGQFKQHKGYTVCTSN